MGLGILRGRETSENYIFLKITKKKKSWKVFQNLLFLPRLAGGIFKRGCNNTFSGLVFL